MSKLPEAAPIPDKPPLHLKGGFLVVASPVDFAEACFSVPAMRALKRFRPMGTLAVLCPESLGAFWETVTEIDEVISYPDSSPARKIVPILKQAKLDFESAILWEAGESAKAIARVGVLQRLGYPVKGLQKWLTDPVDRVTAPGPIEHRVRHYLAFVQILGGDAFVRENFKALPLPEAPTCLRIAVVAESEYGPAYQWSDEKFAELKQAMEKKHGSVEWVSIPSRESAKEILASCTALLACDGEVAHWAAHIGLPAVVLFGPGEPEWKRPLGKQSRVVREHVACSPCYLAKCPLDHRCQSAITAEQVMAEVEMAIAER